ncbi:MAG: hypothetical protein ABIE74_02705 [Pseudomonadota bacterium]
MKNCFKVFGVLAAFCLFLSCGSSGTGTTGQQAAENSMDAFIALLFTDAVTPCTDGLAANCNCPGSGTVSGTDTQYTFANCTDTSGNNFNGTITLDQVNDTVSANFPTFDQCTNVTAQNIPGNDAADCAGTITGTCASETVTCTLVDDGEGGCDCNF